MFHVFRRVQRYRLYPTSRLLPWKKWPLYQSVRRNFSLQKKYRFVKLLAPKIKIGIELNWIITKFVSEISSLAFYFVKCYATVNHSSITTQVFKGFINITST